MLTVHSLPELRHPVLVCALSGWSDAGASASGALAFLAMRWHSRRFAEFDPDAVYSYTITRPVTALDAGGQRQLHWPELAFWALDLPHAERDLVLLRGPEPDLRWRQCAGAIVDLARRLQVEQVLTLGCFIAPISHAGPTPIFAPTSHPELGRRLAQLGVRDTSYQGPTAFPTAIVDQASQAGIPAASIWTATPSYLRDAANPKVSATLLASVEHLAGVNLDLDELWAAGRDLERRVDLALRARPDLQRFVGQMPEHPAPPEPEQPPPTPEELPSPKAVLEELEAYLRQLQHGDQGSDQ